MPPDTCNGYIFASIAHRKATITLLVWLVMIYVLEREEEEGSAPEGAD